MAKIKSAIFSRRTKQIVVKLLILAIASFVLTWILEYRHFINDSTATWDFFFNRTKIFFYNALIIFSLLLIIYGFIRKPFMAVAVGTSIILVIGYIHISKFNFRSVPLLPEDFQLTSQAGTLTKFINISDIIRLIIAVILVLILGKILDYLTQKWLKKEAAAPENVWWKRYRLISRVAIIAVGLSGFLITTDFIRHHSGEREINLPLLSSRFTDWNQTQNYAENGFLIGFLYNTSRLEISEPDGYSKRKIQEINSKLDNLKAENDAMRTNVADSDINFIVVLNESFYDPSIISEYYNYTGGDVTPNLHAIQQQTPSGKMYSPDYGGGTANIEYEIITGLTNYWFKTVPYTNFIPYKKNVSSLASYMKENGYNTSTIHPFVSGMYKRDVVLPKLGFNNFIDQLDFSFTEKEGDSEYINDRSTYKQAIDYIEQTPERDFVSLITMQNHAPYLTNEYGESDYIITNIENLGEKNAAETYLMTLHKSDQFLGELIEMINNLDEKTIVLFYGDHSPGVFPNVMENKDQTISNLIRLTPYFIYANFDYGQQPSDTLPTTTPNCLTNTLFNSLGLQKPKWYYLLDTICTEEPILAESYFGSKAPLMSTELSEYKLLTYDMVAGKQYSN